MRGGQLLVAVVLSAGCDSSTEPLREVRIEAVTATDLTGTVGTAVTPVPMVLATDQDGRPVQGVAISFDVGGNGGAIANASVNTDNRGLASAGSWTLGTAAGTQSLAVRFNGRSNVVFTARAMAGPVAQITRANGNDQVAATNETLLHPLLVKVADAFDNPVVDATVTFTVISGDGRIDGSTAMTNAIGIAASGPWTLGSVPGVQQVIAQTAGAEVVFSAFACDGCHTFLFVRDRYIYRTIGNGAQELQLTQGFQPAWSPDGKRIAFVRFGSGERFDIYLMDADGSNIVRRTSSGGGRNFPGFHSPTWSPDGLKLAVATDGVYDGFIYVLSAADDGNDPRVIAEMAARPAWSPDGSKIAFVSLSGDDGYHALHVMNADGSDIREVAPRGAHGIDHPTWSPDGRRIAFTKCVFDATAINNSCDVYSVGSDGSALTQLTRGKSTNDPAWSPDGAWIAFTLWSAFAEPRAASIAIVPADTGGEPVTIIASGTQSAWRPGLREDWR